MASPASLRIDFVSDVACPWCAIGFAGLRQALARLDGEVRAEIHLQPFELDPQMPAGGDDANQRLMRKYGIGEAQLEANRRVIRERASALGVTINTGEGSRAWNTFDAHRLLHWAGEDHPDRVLDLKQALFRAYFTDNDNVADHGVLLRLAVEVGLDVAVARRVLENNEFADAVRSAERMCQQAGIHSVPATIVNGSWLISGGQPAEAFEQALREIATRPADA